jgi:hypothetical protein
MLLKKMILVYLIHVLSAIKNMTSVDHLDVKMMATIKLGILLSPITFLFDLMSKWTIDNGDFIGVVLGAIIIDHILGSIKHAFYYMDFTWRENIRGIFTKIALVVACGFLFEGLQVVIHGETILTEYLKTITRLIVFLYPAGSAFQNSSVLTGGKFPPNIWLEKLKKFQKDMKIENFNQDIKNKKNEDK